jgi:4-amino-4-deoxy-L-arabinose transferase-like glycosyltransferase
MVKHSKFLLFLLMAMTALLVNVGSYGVIESSDARYAEIARAMYLSGDYLHPNLMEVHHYHKPPFTYQITSLGFHLFGINSFGARFFLQIAIAIQLILIYALTLELFTKKETALWASMIYFSFPLVLMASRNLTTDAFLSMFVLLSIYLWVRYRKKGAFRYLYLFTLSLALGFLTKGPVVFIVPIIFILLYNRNEPPKNPFGYHHLFSWILFVGVAFSWFIYLVMENIDFLDYFLGYQTVDRFSQNVFDRSEPFWYFLLFAPLVGLPWLVILPYLIQTQKHLFTKKSLYVTLLFSLLIPLIFFSLASSKRILYILPFYSLFAILIAQLWSLLLADQTKRVYQILLGYALMVLFVFASTLFIETKWILPKGLGIVALSLLSLLWLFRNAKISLKMRAIILSCILSAFLLISSGVIFVSNELQLKSMKPIAEFIMQKGLQDREIIVYNLRRPSLAFHLNRPIISVYYQKKELMRETQFEKDLHFKKYLLNDHKKEDRAYLNHLTQSPTVLLIYKDNVPKWLTTKYANKKVMGDWRVFY